jgi:hypothetical protein
MMVFALIVAILLPLLMAMAFLLGRHLQRREQPQEQYSAVTRQHFELFQGGHLNEATVEAAKRRFRDLLERGEVATVEASLRPGMQYVFQVRALAEIGTDTAGRILERQLHRRLSDDQLEQAWYWIDLAGSLRTLNRAARISPARCPSAISSPPRRYASWGFRVTCVNRKPRSAARRCACCIARWKACVTACSPIW